MKFRRRSFRKRPSRYRMMPLHLCPYEMTIPASPTGWDCDNPFQQAQELVNLSGALPFAEQTIAKGILVRGIYFNYDYATLGEADLGAFGFLGSRTALVRLPKDPLTGAPSFLPNLYTPSEIQVTQRVLWRGHDVLWTFDNSTGLPYGDSRLGGQAYSSSLMPGNASSQPNIRVKTACRVHENEAIYFVTNVISNFINFPLRWSGTLFGTAAVRTILS